MWGRRGRGVGENGEGSGGKGEGTGNGVPPVHPLKSLSMTFKVNTHYVFIYLYKTFLKRSR